MNVLRVVVLLFVLLVGLVVGAKNSTEVDLNFVFSSVHTTLGFAIVVSLLIGVLVGSGLVLFFSLIPTYTKLRKAHKALDQVQQMTPGSTIEADPTRQQQAQRTKKGSH